MHVNLRKTITPPALAATIFSLLAVEMAAAQPAPNASGVNDTAAWQSCVAESDPTARLACFDRRAGKQGAAPEVRAQPAVTASVPSPAPASHAGCHDPSLSQLSRFWELEADASCGVFGIRSYRPMTMALVFSDSVNRQPTSENPENNAPAPVPYKKTEMRLQLSVRSKLAEGLLMSGGPLRDSLWFGYTQQSYWQVFTGDLSRPFRETDHEPEVIYAYPLQLEPLAGWRLRYGGVGVVHQSNGQSLPLSRSWNRVYLMTGLESSSGLSVQARVWRRIHEDPATDDNPGISDTVGRAELITAWKTGGGHDIILTLRNSLHSLHSGSVRLDWMAPIESGPTSHFGSLRLHTQLFTGYGDSLIDYNRQRTVLSVGLSLFDW